MARLGMLRTDAIDAIANATASPNTAGSPSFQPSRPDNPAPTALPAWLYAWLMPVWRANPDCRNMPSVMPLTAGPIAAPAMAVATCDSAIGQNDCDSRITA